MTYRVLRDATATDGGSTAVADPKPAEIEPTTPESTTGDATRGGKPAREPATPPKAEDDGPRFTQADLDRVVKDRLARERKAADDKAKTDADANRKAAEDKALKEQGDWKTLAEQAAADLKAEKDARAGREAELQASLKAERLARAVEFEAYQNDFHDPDDAMRLLDPAVIAFDDDGAVDHKSVKAAVEKLAKAKPWLIDAAADADPAVAGKARPAAGRGAGTPPPAGGPPRPGTAPAGPPVPRRNVL